MSRTTLSLTLAALLGAVFAVGSVAHAQGNDAPGKTVLQHTDFPGNGYETNVIKTTVPPGGVAPLHEHAGIEIGYIVKGGGTLHVQGKPDVVLTPGTSSLVPPNTPHWFTNGNETTEIVSTYVTESGKPLMKVLKKAP